MERIFGGRFRKRGYYKSYSKRDKFKDKIDDLKRENNEGLLKELAESNLVNRKNIEDIQVLINENKKKIREIQIRNVSGGRLLVSILIILSMITIYILFF